MITLIFLHIMGTNCDKTSLIKIHQAYLFSFVYNLNFSISNSILPNSHVCLVAFCVFSGGWICFHLSWLMLLSWGGLFWDIGVWLGQFNSNFLCFIRSKAFWHIGLVLTFYIKADTASRVWISMGTTYAWNRLLGARVKPSWK
jgi:hypothetical protein